LDEKVDGAFINTTISPPSSKRETACCGVWERALGLGWLTPNVDGNKGDPSAASSIGLMVSGESWRGITTDSEGRAPS